MDPIDCPRCGATAVAAEACPRCGVVFAKVRASRPRPAAAAPPPSPEPSASGTQRWMPWVVGAAVAAVAAVAFALVTRRDPDAAPDPARAAEAAPADALEDGAPADDAPPPSLAGADAPVDVPVIDAGAVAASETDRALIDELASRVRSPSSVRQADVEAAEQLVARHEGEASLRDLLEAILLTAANNERGRRQYPAAATHLRRAMAVAPQSVRPLLALLQVLLEAGDWAGAEGAARGALAVDGRNADAWQGLGYALLRQDRNREAAEALRSALEVRDDAATRALLARVEKALGDEQGMTEQHLSHFNVRYDGDAHEAVGREILRALERHYATLAVALDHQPAATVPVILFTRQGYYDASGAPAWSGGVYDSLDGRIRIPIGGLGTSLTPDMDQTLIHELTHAFVADRTRGVAPREVHEGLAQYMEGKRSAALASPRQLTALADGRFGGVGGFYLASLSFVEHLIATRGMGGINDLLRAMGETGKVDDAFRAVQGGTYAEAQRAWAERLRREYGS